MCGFTGYINSKEKDIEVINKMSDAIKHRGENYGFYVDEKIALSFRRLNIYNKENMNDCVYNEDNTLTIGFDGEIDNYKVLKEELESKGHVFKTTLHEELVIHGYEEYKSDILTKLEGFFSFVIWDIKNCELFGARDIYGIKPFYYGNRNDTFFFGSEIKSFLFNEEFKKEFNKNALRPYLTFQYPVLEETFFKGIYKLLPGFSFTYKDGVIIKNRYHDFNFKPGHTSLEESVESIDKAVKEAVKERMDDSIEIGSFLSSGVDSSYIVSIQKPKKTFSVGFDNENFNESIYAKELSDKLGIENVSRIVPSDECMTLFPMLQYQLDEPGSNPSVVPLYFLSKLAKEHVPVVFSGEGSDEFFGGYEWYRDTPKLTLYKKLPKFIRKGLYNLMANKKGFKGRDIIIKGGSDVTEYFIGQAFIFDNDEALEILKDKYKKGPSYKEVTKEVYDRVKELDDTSKKQYLDLNLWMPHDICLKADKMCIANSLLVRMPFLDRKLLKIAETLPTAHKTTKETTKYALRLAANKNLPDEWATRPKKGFPTPIKYWIKEDKHFNMVKEYFNSDYAKEFFDTNKINKILDDYKQGVNNEQRKIWTLFSFLVWYKEYFINR